MPNCPQAVCSFYALNRIGAVSNMIHPLSAAGEIKFYLNFSHSKAVLTLDQFYTKVAGILPELENQNTTLLVAKIEDELLPHPRRRLRADRRPQIPEAPEKRQLSVVERIHAHGRKAQSPAAEGSGQCQ